MPAIETVAPIGRRSPRGFALAAAIFALVVIAALVSGGFFAARQEMRIGLNSRTSLRAFTTAEAGIDATIAGWQTGSWNAVAVGDSAAVSGSLGSGASGSRYSGSVRRLNAQLFLLRVTGSEPGGSAQRTLLVLTRLRSIPMDVRAALTTRGPTRLGGSASLDGRDAVPSGWSGCPASGLDTRAALRLPDASDVAYSDCGGLSCLSGEPRVSSDPAIGDSTFFTYGDLEWADLVAMATKVYPTGDVGPLRDVGPVGTATACSASAPDNWGDPRRGASTAGCWHYFPIIYVDGNLKLDGGYGQGILLVSGDLEVQGGTEFVGPVVVRGSLRTSGTGGRLTGGVLAANVDRELNSVLGNTVVAYSSCTLAAALQANTPGRPVRERSWAEVY